VVYVNLHEVELIEEISQLDSRNSLRYAFPLSSAEGTASTAAVYFELEPGKRLSRHTDSAEEVLIVLEGAAEATIGEQRGKIGPGGVVVVPAMEPHDVTNVGDRVTRVVGVFSSATVVSTFEEPLIEGGDQVFVIGAPLPLASPLAEAGS
jgi:quercetin dioxygenase-like cupin family protein